MHIIINNPRKTFLWQNQNIILFTFKKIIQFIVCTSKEKTFSLFIFFECQVCIQCKLYKVNELKKFLRRYKPSPKYFNYFTLQPHEIIIEHTRNEFGWECCIWQCLWAMKTSVLYCLYTKNGKNLFKCEDTISYIIL